MFIGCGMRGGVLLSVRCYRMVVVVNVLGLLTRKVFELVIQFKLIVLFYF